jgi:hypothetical protein
MGASRDRGKVPASESNFSAVAFSAPNPLSHRALSRPTKLSKTASLFDMPAEPPREAVVQPETEDEDDILAEIKDDGAEEEGEQEDVADAA